MGTPGYFPDRDDWKEGDVQWDVWALAAIIIECDMKRNEYYSCKRESDSKQRIKLYLGEKQVSPKIKEMAEKIILRPQRSEKITLEQI